MQIFNGIYGIANIILERTFEYMDKIDVEIVLGITYAISGAALLGSPLTQDFAVVTLSDNLADKGIDSTCKFELKYGRTLPYFWFIPFN